ncbi:hypothetical protein Mame01_50940 [Microbispora amethystogenes]|nr:hypothetical protein Mame01_50940 [Microbispora amethystogenes]
MASSQRTKYQYTVCQGGKSTGSCRQAQPVRTTYKLVVCMMAASVQDRDGAKTTLLSMYLVTPVRYVFADAGFAESQRGQGLLCPHSTAALRKRQRPPPDPGEGL